MKYVRKYKYYIILILVLLIAFFIVLTKINLDKESDIEVVINEEEKSVEVIEIEEKIYVEIKGEVINPGVYETKTNERVNDIIKKAGGLTENADTSLNNLAKLVTDEMVIIIYSKEEVQNSKIENTVIKVIEQECSCPSINNDACLNSPSSSDLENITDKVSLNKASKEELMLVPNVGESKALAIIQYRNEVGEFKSVEDLLNVDGIGQTTYEKIKIYFSL